MGQYYYVVNVDKGEYLHPHKMGDGLKLMEFGCSGFGTMAGLALLLAESNGRGGGDWRGNDPDKLVGSWAGDRIVIAGDYAEPNEKVTFNRDAEGNLYDHADEYYEDISEKVRYLLEQDPGDIRRPF